MRATTITRSISINSVNKINHVGISIIGAPILDFGPFTLFEGKFGISDFELSPLSIIQRLGLLYLTKCKTEPKNS